MISATDVADADAETRASEEPMWAVEAPPARAGDRARAKFCAIVEGRARGGPRALPFPLGADEEACDPDMSYNGSGGVERRCWVFESYKLDE